MLSYKKQKQKWKEARIESTGSITSHAVTPNASFLLPRMLHSMQVKGKQNSYYLKVVIPYLHRCLFIRCASTYLTQRNKTCNCTMHQTTTTLPTIAFVQVKRRHDFWSSIQHRIVSAEQFFYNEMYKVRDPMQVH